MSVIIKIILIIQIIVLIYLSISALYYFVFAVAGLFRRAYRPPDSEIRRSFCILVPGYKEDWVIVQVAKDAVKQAYPHDLYDVYIIADSFKKETLDELKKLPVKVLEVEFDVSTKAKSLNKAMELIDKDYDGIIILDADNLMDLNFIKKMNNALGTGVKAVQGHRMAKNLNTSFAVLDAISEEINNHIFRKGHRALGLSSALIGSGMGFDYQLFKEYMATIDSHAEDKELEIKLFKDRHKIEYVDTAYVLDEKVSRSDVFLKQRSRWIANQLLYARRHFFEAFLELFKGNIDYFDKIFQYLLPPRVILLGILYIVFALSLVFNPYDYKIAWSVVFVVVNVGIIISVPKRYYNKSIFKHLFKLPLGFLLMSLSIINIKEARKSFNPTPHIADIEDENNEKQKKE